MNIHKLVSLVVVSVLVAILFASALNSYTRVSDSALADSTLLPSDGGGVRGGGNAPHSTPSQKWLPVIFLNASADLYWSINGNGGTNPNTNFLGTTDNVTLTFRVSNTVAFRIAPAVDPCNGFAPNIIGGYGGNNVEPGVYGATIVGGGVSGWPNSVHAGGNYAFVGGGEYNTASGQFATVGGGFYNTASNTSATVGGGYANTAGYAATVGGGTDNTASNSFAAIGGGNSNNANGGDATIGGGYINTASGDYATIGGGYQNNVSGYVATVGGGFGNTTSGQYATVPGGGGNTASGDYSFAAGRNADTNNQSGAFVWADSTNAPFASTGNDQFLIRANGGVGINTNSPQATLDVSGSLRVNTGGTVFNRIQAGTSSVPTSTIASTVFTVTFPSAFLTTPRVIATPRGEDLDETFVVTTRRISATYAVFNIIRIDQSAGWTQNLQLDWFVWE